MELYVRKIKECAINLLYITLLWGVEIAWLGLLGWLLMKTFD